MGGCILLCQLFGVMLCPLRRYTGIPCFTCGSTRAVLALVSGDFKTAFLTQPLIVSLACFIAPVIFFNLFVAVTQKRVILISLARQEKIGLAIILIATTLANWLYLLNA